MRSRWPSADRQTRKATLIAVIASACTNFDALGPSPEPLPADNPGQVIPGLENGSAFAWNPVSGRLIVPVYLGNRSFSIVSVDPQTRAVKALVGQTSGLFRQLSIAASTGTTFYSFDDASGASNSRLLRRVPLDGGSSESVSTPRPVTGSFLVSPEGTHLLFASSTTEWTLTDLVSGEEVGTREVSVPRAVGPGGNEVIVQYPTARAVNFSTGVVRELAPLGYLAHAAWVDGGWRALWVLPPFGERQAFTAYEWDEAAGTTRTLGSVTARPSGSTFCAGWSPSTHSAVIMADSISSGGFIGAYYVHHTIATVSGGVAKTIGSANLEGEGAPPCALSPDGKHFAYSGAREFLGGSAVFLKETK